MNLGVQWNFPFASRAIGDEGGAFATDHPQYISGAARHSADLAAKSGAQAIRITGQAATNFHPHPVLPWEILSRKKRKAGVYRTVKMGHLDIKKQHWEGDTLVITEAEIVPHKGKAFRRAWGRKLGRMLIAEPVPYWLTCAAAYGLFLEQVPWYLVPDKELPIDWALFTALLLVPQGVSVLWIMNRARLRGFAWK